MLELYGIFKDGMVLQRNKDINVFGFAKKSVKVEAELLNGSMRLASASTTAESDGSFLLKIPPQQEGGPYRLKITAGKTCLTLKEVYVGIVWLACGQDNMLMPLKMLENPRAQAALIGECDRLHYYQVPTPDTMDQDMTQAEKDARWVNIDPNTAPEMSAVCYFFALELLRKLDCHVGVIGCFGMSASVSGFQSMESLMKTPQGRRYIETWEEIISEISYEEYKIELKEYNEDVKGFYEVYSEYSKLRPYEGYDTIRKTIGDWPYPVPRGLGSALVPGGLFEKMVLRVVPYGIEGVLYYQGETDTEDNPRDYKAAFESLVREWRQEWGDPDLPFIVCQLHMYIDRDRKFMGYEDFKWPILREMQHQASLELNNVYLAILSDCGEFDNMHPVDKDIPGQRLARLALKNIYGFSDVSAVAPYMIDIRTTNGGAEMSFNGDFSMLVMKGFGDSGFEVSGKDGVFYPCSATVDFDGKTVTAFSPYVLEPVTVRYAYFSFGQSSLSSDTGLAVLPFSRNVIKNLDDAY